MPVVKALDCHPGDFGLISAESGMSMDGIQMSK